MPLNLSLLSSYSSPSPPRPRAFHVCVILTKPKKSSVTMQLFKLQDSGTELRVSISNNFCLREKAVGCPFTEHRMMWWARKEAPFIQRHSKGVGQRAKLCSSLTRWWKRLETCRQRSCCAVVFLCKLSFFFFTFISFCSSACHWLPYLFLYPTLPYNVPSPTAFILYCSYFHSFPIKFTLLCQSSSWKQHFCCCFHSFLLAPVCHPPALCPPPPECLNASGGGTAWSCVLPVPE